MRRSRPPKQPSGSPPCNTPTRRCAAPDDGIVSKLTAHEGQLVSIGHPVAGLVPDLTYVIANFKETQLDRMRPGQRAVIRIDAYPGHTLQGRVESLSGATGARFR